MAELAGSWHKVYYDDPSLKSYQRLSPIFSIETTSSARLYKEKSYALWHGAHVEADFGPDFGPVPSKYGAEHEKRQVCDAKDEAILRWGRSLLLCFWRVKGRLKADEEAQGNVNWHTQTLVEYTWLVTS